MTTTLVDRPAKASELLIQELQQTVGRQFVSVQPLELRRWGRTTLPDGGCPLLAARPANVAEVRRLVQCAGRHRLPIYPISGGKNWGYGDSCPPRAGCLLLDLSRLNRILEVNAELAYAVVEPGVTQGQLFEHLQERRIPLWMDATGAGPDTSIVGNILERGVGLSPYSDRFAHACALEVVLPDGRLLRTGFGEYPHAQAQHLYSYGCGPVLDGLFSQANLGIVTRLTFWLMPKPAAFCAFYISLQLPESIGPLIEVLRRLRLSGTVRSSVHCFNQMRLLGSQLRFPWSQADGRQALEVGHPDLTQALLKRYQIPTWLATGSLSGSALEVAAARKVVQRALRTVPDAKVRFVDARALGRMNWLRNHLPHWQWFQPLRRRLEQVARWTAFLQGRANHQTLAGAHWRARGQAGPNQDPLDSQAGLIWVCPVLPMTARSLSEVSRLGQAAFHRFGFEYQVTLSQVSDRALAAVMSIHFDRQNPEETQRAKDCHDALVRELLRHGYPPYRGCPRTVDLLHESGLVYWDVARRLKQALDPHDLIAPGRYIPSCSKQFGR